MATNLVPPKGSCMVMCHQCKGMYMPENTTRARDTVYFETCPFCGYSSNRYKDTIPIWKYNLIKFFRSGSQCEDIEAKLTEFDITTTTNERTIEEKFEKKKPKNLSLAVAPKKKKEPETPYNGLKEWPKAPNPSDYLMEVYFEKDGKTKERYRIFDIVDSMADLPHTGDMRINDAYYVEAKKKFAVVTNVFWDLDTPLEKSLYGHKREEVLEQLYQYKKKFAQIKMAENTIKPLMGMPRILEH